MAKDDADTCRAQSGMAQFEGPWQKRQERSASGIKWTIMDRGEGNVMRSGRSDEQRRRMCVAVVAAVVDGKKCGIERVERLRW